MSVGIDPSNLLTSGLSLFGTAMQYSIGQQMQTTAAQESLTAQNEAKNEMDINAQKHQQMVLDNQRQQYSAVRNMQLARSMALSSSTNQGAQFGSALGGAKGQISGQGNNQVLALNQNLALGNKVFQDQQQIGYDRMGMSIMEGDMAKYKGESNMWGSLTQAAGPIGRIFGNIAQGGTPWGSQSGGVS